MTNRTQEFFSVERTQDEIKSFCEGLEHELVKVKCELELIKYMQNVPLSKFLKILSTKIDTIEEKNSGIILHLNT